MAKSLRSKRKRKMRAIKRERYGAKELDKLKQIVKQAKRKKSNETQTNAQGNKDNNNDNMDTDKPEVDPVTLQNKDGNFPIWMNHRQIRKHKSKLKKKKELKLKRLKSKRT